jgi:hypothetical protein
LVAGYLALFLFTEAEFLGVIGRKKMPPTPESVRYRNKETQSGIGMIRYWTRMLDVGMPIPATLALMPMLICY